MANIYLVYTIMLNKEQKNKVISCLELICSKTRMSSKTMGYALRSYHVSAPIIYLIYVTYASQFMASLMVLNLFVCLSLFIIYGGCFLSSLEHRLCGDEFTIADPFLEILGLELNNKNRMNITYCIAGGYTTLFFIIYYLRFFYGRKTAAATLV